MYPWIEDNATAISAIAAAASALYFTIRTFGQARRAADLGDKSASAAKVSADVGAENLRLVLRRIGEETQLDAVILTPQLESRSTQLTHC